MSSSKGRGAYPTAASSEAMAAGSTAPVVGVHSYRDHFNQTGRATLTSTWDARRCLSWAPYVVVPTVVVTSKAVPVQHRVKLWVGTLTFYAFVSVAMYNTDSSSDHGSDGPPMIRLVQQPDITSGGGACTPSAGGAAVQSRDKSCAATDVVC